MELDGECELEFKIQFRGQMASPLCHSLRKHLQLTRRRLGE